MSSFSSEPSTGERTSEKNKMNSRMQGDLEFNNLSYEAPEALSLRLHRVHRRDRAELNQYSSNQTAVIRWNTGSDYVNPVNSFLVFSLQLQSAGASSASFGAKGSAANCIREIRVVSKSGIECDRLRRVNHYVKNYMRYQYSQDYMDKYATLMGAGSSVTDTTAVKFVLPLQHICGFFKPVGDAKLIPPSLASGLEVHVTFEDYRNALTQSSGAITEYTISNVSCLNESIRLTDSAQRVLNERAALSGLSYVFYRNFTTEQESVTNVLNLKAQLSVGQAHKACLIVVDRPVTPDVTIDNFANKNFDWTRYSWRLGQLYFPATPISDDSIGRESLFLTLNAWNKHEMGSYESSVSAADFISGGMAMVAQDLSNDPEHLMSGQSINNSRMLVFDGERSGAAANQEAILFVQHLAVCKAFLDNIVVSI